MTLDELYETLYDELSAWASAMCGDETLAEDLVQEGFVRAIIHSKTVLSLHDKQQRAWLYKTIKNIRLDRARRLSFETIADAPEIACITDEYDSADIAALLGALPDIEGVLFNMRYFQGYGSNELGRIFNMPAGTVRSKLSSARKRLRKMLEN